MGFVGLFLGFRVYVLDDLQILHPPNNAKQQKPFSNKGKWTSSEESSSYFVDEH
jgi:hypothetical protein